MSEYIGRSVQEMEEDSVMRVVVNRAGETIHASVLAKQCREALHAQDPHLIAALADTNPTTVFIRKDGWMLAASPRFESVAYGMWSDEWVGFCQYPDDIIQDIEDYVPGRMNF